MRLLLILVLTLWPALASAQDVQAEFDARRLAPSELRYLQAALILDGTYLGLIDGKWGRRSHEALLASARARSGRQFVSFADLRPVLDAFAREQDQARWTALYLDAVDLSFLVPTALVETGTSKYPTLRSPSGDLLIRSLLDGNSEAADRHQWLLDNHRGPAELYSSYREGRLITAAQLDNGKIAYLRSDRAGAGLFHSLLVQYDPWQARRGQMVASSITTGRQPDLGLPAGGMLARVVSGSAPPAAAPPQVSVAIPAPDAQPNGSGTGFFVNNTDLVTAAHVVNGCTALKLEDGTPLTLLGSDAALDLAVLSSARRTVDFLPLGSAEQAKLGEDVFALGYPYLQLLGQGLIVTGGNVGALPGFDDPAKRMMITAPVQPGNSGGPVMNRDGAVVGVVVSRFDDIAILKETGSLPQNINFAVSTAPLLDFLKRQQVFFAEDGHDATPIGNGIPERTQHAVVPILCY